MPETPDASIAALYAQLQRFARLYQFRDPNNACLYDLRVNECYLLQLVAENGPLSVSALSAQLGIHKSNASRIARSLAAAGFLEEKPDPEDGRSIRWHATRSGHQKSALIRTHMMERYARALGGLDRESLRILAEGIERLTDDAETRIVSGADPAP